MKDWGDREGERDRKTGEIERERDRKTEEDEEGER